MNTYVVQLDLRPKFSEVAADKFLHRVRRDIAELEGMPDRVVVRLLINAYTLRTHCVSLIADSLPRLDYEIVVDSPHTAREWARLARERASA